EVNMRSPLPGGRRHVGSTAVETGRVARLDSLPPSTPPRTVAGETRRPGGCPAGSDAGRARVGQSKPRLGRERPRRLGTLLPDGEPGRHVRRPVPAVRSTLPRRGNGPGSPTVPPDAPRVAEEVRRLV